MSRARDLSRLSSPSVFSVDASDASNNKVGLGSENPTAKLNVAGIISATAFYGDGSNLEGVASAGLGTALGENNPLDVIYYTNDILNVTDNTTITVPTGSDTAYTQYAEVVVADSKDLIIADGDDFIPDVLGLSTAGVTPITGTGGRVRADFYTNHAGTGAPTFQTGVNITGIATAASFSGNLTGNVTGTTGTFTGNVSVGGTLTYEDVTNIDSIGIITARSGIEFGVSGAGGTITSAGAATFTGELQAGTRVRFNTKGTRSNAQSVIDIYDQDGQGVSASTVRIDADGDATFAGVVSDSIGPLRRLGVNGQSGAYAFVVGDAGKIIRSSGSGSALTLNQNIFTAGDMISVFNVGSGNNTVVQGTGVTLYNTADAATGTRTIAAKGMVTIVCTASNEFAISGSQLT